MDFSEKVISWGRVHGRKNLPWQRDKTPYSVWVSEIMLQQTQVNTVIPYYEKFMASFPDLQSLASAEVDQVLSHWSGLGYYARARNLHKTAVELVSQGETGLPDDREALQSLPGIGKSTAAAILSLACGQSHAILDGNVKRVLARCFAVDGWPGQSSVLKMLWALSEKVTPQKQTALFNQTMMDLGSKICTRGAPKCEMCPLQSDCQAFALNLQTCLPSKKTKKKLPVKEVYMLVIENKEGAVCLVKRPPTGIWGGLWSFPELANCKPADLHSAIRESHGIDVDILEQLPQRRHTFSHFHLDIKPLRCQTSTGTENSVRDEAGYWVKKDTFHKLGLAAPVSRLIEEIFTSRSES